MLSNDEMRARMQDALDQAGNCFTIEDIASLLREGKLLLMQEGDLATILRIETTPRKKVLSCFMTFGAWTPENYAKLHERACAFGRENHCDFFVTEGRRGWSRELGKLGWETTGVTLKYNL